MISALLVCLASVQAPAFSHRAPDFYVEGEPYTVVVEVNIPQDTPIDLPVWSLTPAAFVFNGRPLGKRDDTIVLRLEPGAKLTIEFDLAPSLEAEFEGAHKGFRLSFGGEKAEATNVRVFEAAEQGIDFMELPLEQLVDYQVVLRTSRGVIWLDMWPGVAPNHVRNFLDLCNTGFYDGTLFHRVIPSFMIQGGRAQSGATAPRTVNAEFSDRKHEAGVLSMSRSENDINSAACEFFIVHAPSTHLDGQYSAFGKVLWGLDVVDRIVHSGDPEFRISDPRSHLPPVDQIVEKAIIVKAKTGSLSED
ncbi:MAG: peptidyl-prolyl cis-trans isomerase B (cyclophilin B) [Chlamydiales bacterium]|jgi:peptidyl-prolyl cis-trans isomerase B (cyclophilin B)